MLIIEGGRSCLYQWDVDQRLEVMSDEITEVHFVNAVTSPALVCEVYEEDGRRFANVPNILLQQSWPIQAYGCCGSRVRDVETCKVIRRERPADYVYTETELKTFASLEERIKELEENGTGGGVQTVCGKEPDENGDVELDASDVHALPDTGGTVNGSVYLGDRTSTNACTFGIRKKIDNDRYLEGFAKPYGSGFQFGASEFVKSSNGGYTSQPNAMTFDADKIAVTKPILFDSADARTKTRESLNLYSKAEVDEAITEAVANVESTPGTDGKSAYQYAQDGGYTGTEAEFAARLAGENKPELIERITCDGTYGAITRTELSLRKLWIYFDVPVAEAKYNINVNAFGANNYQLGYANITEAISTVRRCSGVYAVYNEHEAYMERIAPASLPYNAGAVARTTGRMDGTNPISKINITTSNSGVLPAGTIVEIWGVRA